MNYSAETDLFCIIMLLFLSGYSIFIAKYRDKLSGIFIVMSVLCTAVLAGDYLTSISDGNPSEWAFAFNEAGNFIVYFFLSALVFSYFWYTYTYIQQKTTVSVNYFYVAVLTMIGQIISFLFAQSNHLYYYFDSKNFFVRGAYYWLPYAFALFITILTVWIVFRSRNHLDKREIFSFTGFMLLPFLAACIQFLTYDWLKTVFLFPAFSFSILMTFLNIQNGHLSRVQEERMEVILELQGISEAYTGIYRWNFVKNQIEASVALPQYKFLTIQSGDTTIFNIDKFLNEAVEHKYKLQLMQFLSPENFNNIADGKEKAVREMEFREYDAIKKTFNWRRVLLIYLPNDYKHTKGLFIAFMDISYEKKLEEQTKNQSKRFVYSTASIYKRIIEGKFSDNSLRYLEFSDDTVREFKMNIGWAEYVQDKVENLVHPDDAERFRKIFHPEFLENMEEGKSNSCTYRAKDNGKEGYRWNCTTVKITTREDGSRMALYLIQDIDDDIRERNHLLELSEHDELTGMFNRTKYRNMMEGEYRNLRSCGVIFFDINNLKKTNDTCGHDVGDELICKAADSIRSVENQDVQAYRIGGDEFVLIACNVSDRTVNELLDDWKESLLAQNNRGGIHCTMAYGTAWGAGDFNIESLVKQADERMYDNKVKMKADKNKFARLF